MRAPTGKTMLENYLECYHCAVAHPGFSAAIDVTPENYNLTAHGWFASQVGQVRQSALEGKAVTGPITLPFWTHNIAVSGGVAP